MTLFIAPILTEGLLAGIITALDGQVPGAGAPLFQDMVCSRFAEPSHWEDWTLDMEVAAIELLRQRSEIDELDLVLADGLRRLCEDSRLNDTIPVGEIAASVLAWDHHAIFSDRVLAK